MKLSFEERAKMKRPAVYNVDLTKIEGEGDFPCPNCGVIISPEDETETVYTILQTKMKREYLQELIIQCNRCGSKIHLVGFLSPVLDRAKTETTPMQKRFGDSS